MSSPSQSMSPIVLLVSLCIAQILAMAGFANFAVLLNDFGVLWNLSSTQAGWISGVYFAGYVAAVPILVGLTDAIDARRIYLFGVATGVVSSVGFGLFADGFASAMGFRFLAGISLAGTYMPGLQILNDRLSESHRQRALPWYLSVFSLGTAASFYATGLFSAHVDWQTVFLLAGGAQVACWFLIIILIRPKQPDGSVKVDRHPLDFRPVFRNRPALAYIWAYTGHTYELFAYRAWIVAFLLFAASASDSVISRESVSGFAALLSLLGMPASLIGAHIALRRERRQTISVIMVLSILAGSLLGFTSALPFEYVRVLAGLYSIFIMSDSAAITGGVVAAARQGERGATLAMHSVMGFSGGFLGPLVVGMVLDLTAGSGSIVGWGFAFMAMAAGSLAAIVGLRWLLAGKMG